jgi:hypothetical protein
MILWVNAFIRHELIQNSSETRGYSQTENSVAKWTFKLGSSDLLRCSQSHCICLRRLFGSTMLPSVYTSEDEKINCNPFMQLALVVFHPTNGTARCNLSTSPWTGDIEVFIKWLDVLPSLMEGIGSVAAFEAMSEALSLLEQPSKFTPIHRDKSPLVAREFISELVMLWVSEASPSASCLAIHPMRARVAGTVRLESGLHVPITIHGVASCIQLQHDVDLLVYAWSTAIDICLSDRIFLCTVLCSGSPRPKSRQFPSLSCHAMRTGVAGRVHF